MMVTILKTVAVGFAVLGTILIMGCFMVSNIETLIRIFFAIFIFIIFLMISGPTWCVAKDKEQKTNNIDE